MRANNLKRVRNVAMFFVVAAVWIFYFFPIYWMVTTSFKTRVDTFSIPPKWIFWPTLQYYVSSFTDPKFLKVIQNSLIITGNDRPFFRSFWARGRPTPLPASVSKVRW